MPTVLTHFRNDERMLRWWLNHHVPRFDHGILIDHGSTDGSLDACRDLAPHWTLIRSPLHEFAAIDYDFEIMKEEEKREGWKICLTVSEFLAGPDPRSIVSRAERDGAHCLRTRGVWMVDRQPEVDPDPGLSLLSQKPFGFVEEGWRLSYAHKKRTKTRFHSRVLHRYAHGAYSPGRHSTFRHVDGDIADAFTCWFSYSPWSPWFIERKVGFGATVSSADMRQRLGVHHMRGVEELDRTRRWLARIASDLRLHPVLGPHLV